MKNIYELLASVEVAMPEEKKADFDKALLENYRTIEDYNKQSAKLAALDEDSKATKEALKKLEGGNQDSYEQKIAELTAEIERISSEQAEKEAAQQKEEAEKEFLADIEKSIAAAKGKDAKTILPLLDIEALRVSKNRDADLSAALETVKGEKEFLFDTTDGSPPPKAVRSTSGLAEPVTKEEFAKYGYLRRLALKKENPDLYNQLNERN
ncbi:MAG: phage scaffolding protein [Oscillospiraceae bacterium]